MPQPDRRKLDQGYGVGREFVEVRRDADAVVVRSSFWAAVFGYLAIVDRAHFVVALGT
jgi:hypothetical protein